MVPVSPFATPSSMIVALMVGRYSDASALINWSAATIRSAATGTAAHTAAAGA